MVDLTATQLYAKGAAPPGSREGGGGRSRPLWPSPRTCHLHPPSIEANKLYHQLAEIHAIAAVQLAECACWHQFSPTPNTVCTRASWWGGTVEPSAVRMAPPPPTGFSPQSTLQRGQRVEPQAH
jgi:hypothetical protein